MGTISKTIFGVALTISMTAAAGGQASAGGLNVPDSELSKPGLLRVCADVPVPPYIALDASGNPDGIDPSLASEIAARLGLKSEIVYTEFKTIIAALKGGKCDVIMNAMNITEERQKIIVQIPYARDGLRYALAKGNPKKISTADDLCGVRISVQTGTSGSDAVTGAAGELKDSGVNQHCDSIGKPQPILLQYAKVSDVFLSVASGQSDVTLIDNSVTTDFINAHPSAMEFSALVTPPPTPQGIGVAFSNPKLKEAVEKVLSDLVADGTYNKIFDKYNYKVGALLYK